MSICPDDQKSEMLHENDDDAFCSACGNGYQKRGEWLWAICPDEEQQKCCILKMMVLSVRFRKVI